jgi:2-oxoglutarate dehydrogenase complex dehydrogenase (E1) component-like enzyme
VALVRVEQLFPFPADGLRAALGRYEGAQQLLWVQEEPRNMGAWTFVRPRLEALVDERWAGPRFVGRPASASPATGSSESHKFEQDQIMEEAFAELASA